MVYVSSSLWVVRAVASSSVCPRWGWVVLQSCFGGLVAVERWVVTGLVGFGEGLVGVVSVLYPRGGARSVPIRSGSWG